jgi:hypothetical protein
MLMTPGTHQGLQRLDMVRYLRVGANKDHEFPASPAYSGALWPMWAEG